MTSRGDVPLTRTESHEVRREVSDPSSQSSRDVSTTTAKMKLDMVEEQAAEGASRE